MASILAFLLAVGILPGMCSGPRRAPMHPQLAIGFGAHSHDKLAEEWTRRRKRRRRRRNWAFVNLETHIWQVGKRGIKAKKKWPRLKDFTATFFATRQLPEGHGAEGAVTKKTQPPALEAALKPVRLAMEEQHLLEVPLLVVRWWSWNWNYRRRNGNTVSKLRLLK